VPFAYDRRCTSPPPLSCIKAQCQGCNVGFTKALAFHRRLYFASETLASCWGAERITLSFKFSIAIVNKIFIRILSYSDAQGRSVVTVTIPFKGAYLLCLTTVGLFTWPGFVCSPFHQSPRKFAKSIWPAFWFITTRFNRLSVAVDMGYSLRRSHPDIIFSGRQDEKASLYTTTSLRTFRRLCNSSDIRNNLLMEWRLWERQKFRIDRPKVDVSEPNIVDLLWTCHCSRSSYVPFFDLTLQEFRRELSPLLWVGMCQYGRR